MHARSVVTSIAILGLLVLVGPLPAAAQGKQIQTEAEFISYDAEAGTVTVKVRKPGKGAQPPRNLRLRRGEEAQFNVKAEGSVLTRTTVKLDDGTAGSFEDLQPGRKLQVYWLPDPKDENARFARSISVFVPAEEQGEDAGD